MRKNIILPLILFAVLFVQLSGYSQSQVKDGEIVFVLADEKFPNFISNQYSNQAEKCEPIQSWVRENEQRYFNLLNNQASAFSIKSAFLKTLPIKKQNDFTLCLEHLKSSFQCQRFSLIFNKQELSKIHHSKTIVQYHYLVSKKDFDFIKHIIED